MTTLVFDTGALIALERRDKRIASIVETAVEEKIRIVVPAGVLAQAWRGTPRQHAIGQLLKSKAVTVAPLDEVSARRVGLLLAQSNTADVTDAHVVLLAHSLGNSIVFTSDPTDIAKIDPHLRLVTV